MITTNENIDIGAIAFHSTDNPSNFAEQILSNQDHRHDIHSTDYVKTEER